MYPAAALVAAQRLPPRVDVRMDVRMDARMIARVAACMTARTWHGRSLHGRSHGVDAPRGAMCAPWTLLSVV